LLTAVACLAAQSKRDPLTPQEVEQIREATDRPVERLKIYIQFVETRVTRLEVLVKDAPTDKRAESIHDTLQEYTFLSDELQSNLDEYEGYETNKQRPVPDVRKVLRELQASLPLWKAAVEAAPPDKEYDFARVAALDSTQSLTDGTKEMIASLDDYFAKKKLQDAKQKNQGYVLP
jgi:phosphoglycolate phosphatase-like HAD superfamily hydrolase